MQLKHVIEPEDQLIKVTTILERLHNPGSGLPLFNL